MKIKIDSLQKRIGLLLSVMGVFSITAGIVIHVNNGINYNGILREDYFSVDFILVIPGILSIYFENKYMKILQSASIIIAGTIHIIFTYNELYGPGLFFIGWLLLRQYGFFDNHIKAKYGVFIGLFIISIQLSAYIHDKTVFLLGNSLFQFSLFMILFVLIVWKDIFERDKELIIENKYLKDDYNRITEKLDEIEKNKKPVNLIEAGITPAEERVLQDLVVNRGSNREIADRLHISEPTVKLHLYNIFNKLGVDSRFEVIDLCKYNFQAVAED